MKSLRVKMTEEQLNALHEAASKAGMNASEYIRRCLIERGAIPEVDIQHGGYRERKGKVKK